MKEFENNYGINPTEVKKKIIELKNGIIHETFFINRELKQGDFQGGTKGITDGSNKSITTHVINTVYKVIDDKFTVNYK